MITYRKATLQDMEDVAELHLQIFKGYFLSSFGKELVKKYYEMFLLENDLFVLAIDKQNVVGFCMGDLKGSIARAKFEETYRTALIFSILKQCICLNKQAIRKVMDRLKTCFVRKKQTSQTQSPAISADAADLLSIGVLPEYRGTGCSEKLLLEFEKLLKEKHIRCYTLSVLKENERTKSFYLKHGFTLLHSGRNEIKYVKKL